MLFYSLIRMQCGRALPYLLVLAALAAGLGLWAGQRYLQSSRQQSELANMLRYPQPREVPPFILAGADGNPITQDTLRGHWTLVFIGFTHCPDVCPTTLAQLATAEKQWASLPEAKRPRVLFVSVDPERDSAQRAGEYAAYFSPSILAATADLSVLEPFTRSLAMVYMKTPLPNDDYTVDHSASIAVLDPAGRLAAVVRPPIDAAVLAQDIAALTQPD